MLCLALLWLHCELLMIHVIYLPIFFRNAALAPGDLMITLVSLNLSWRMWVKCAHFLGSTVCHLFINIQSAQHRFWGPGCSQICPFVYFIVILCNWIPHSSFFHGKIKLTHWGRVTHICVGDLTIIGSDNGLSPGRRQAITWTNVGILLIGPLGTNFSEMLIEIHTFSFKKIHLKMLSGKWRPFCLGLNVLNGEVGGYHSTSIMIYGQTNGWMDRCCANDTQLTAKSIQKVTYHTDKHNRLQQQVYNSISHYFSCCWNPNTNTTALFIICEGQPL